MWHKILLLIAVMLNLALLGRLFFSDQGIMGYFALKAENEEVRLEIEKIKEKNLVLSREIELLNSDSKYLEKIIRSKLNFVKDNEILYLFPNNQTHSGVLPDDGEN